MKAAPALAGSPRQEPLVDEPVGGEPGEDERGEDRRRPRDDPHVDPLLDTCPDQPEPRIRHTRHPRVGDERHVTAGLEGIEHLGRPLPLVRIVERDHPGPDPETLEEGPGSTRVLGGHEVDRAERLPGPVGHVAEVADRRAHQEQRAHRSPLRSHAANRGTSHTIAG